MNIKLEQLRVFIAVAETGRLSDASAKIGRTPSALSMTLQQIEDRLGAPLFEGDRKSRLTKLGEYVLVRARRTVAVHQSTMNDMYRFASGEQGTVKVAAVPSAATRLLAPAVKEFRTASTSLRIDIRDTDSETVAEAVRSGRVDFGIASHHGSANDIVATLLLEDPFRLVCLKKHQIGQSRAAVKWQDIDPSEFIANGLCDKIPSPELVGLTNKSPMMVHNTTSLINFVASGFGVTILPALAIPQSPEFRDLPLDDPMAVRRLYVLSRPNETLSPAASQLLSIVHRVTRNVLDT